MAAKYLIPILICVCAVTMRGAAQEAEDSAASSRIVALENAWSRAIEMKDIKAVDTILDNAIVYVDLRGRLMSKAEVLADVKAAHMEQVVTESMSVRLHGGTAVVTGIIRTKGVEGGKPYLRRGRFVDVWMEKAGKLGLYCKPAHVDLALSGMRAPGLHYEGAILRKNDPAADMHV